MTTRQLADLVPTDSVDGVLREVKTILEMIFPDFRCAPVWEVYDQTAGLYEGRFPGYQACNTGYHNFRHIVDTFLAMVRLVHGATVDGETFTHRDITVSLTAAFLHDAGYIQETGDNEGTGAKYTSTHVQRSMDFVQRHGLQYGLTDTDSKAARLMILCTDLAVDTATIRFPSRSIELLGKMLGTADLLAQMADRIYLEKLLYLYQEFREARLQEFRSATDLLHKTLEFYDSMTQRFAAKLAGTSRFMRSHFAARWGIGEDLYAEAIHRQRDYLSHILQLPDSDPLDHLRRDGIVADVRQKTKSP